MSGRRAFLVVLDGLGIGPAPDTAAYGDAGSHTLGNVLAAVPGLELPHLAALGLGCCAPLVGVPPAAAPRAAHGVCRPASAGKDSTTGHWELCGVVLREPFPTFPGGFPDDLLSAFTAATGRGVLGNRPASGTRVLDECGPEHQRTGDWIVYTSADSVFQVAAHVDVVPLEELYAGCEVARRLCHGAVGVARVIARPFDGAPGAYARRSGQRRDYALPPPTETLLDRLAAAGMPVRGIGKVDDLFAGRGITSVHTPTNPDAFRLLEEAQAQTAGGLVFANVIEFDQTWGHRNDVAGFAEGLRALDAWLPRFTAGMGRDDLVILVADHGNDPTTPSTDHSREVVPLLVAGPQVRPVPLGTRATFADVGQTVAEFLGVPALAAGTSFLGEVWPG